jgi:hypothetical protein
MVELDLYGFPVELVSTWCRTSTRTVAAWKAGVSRPSPQAVALFELHSNGRVLSKGEWPGWSIRGNLLLDPDGNRTTQNQLRAYSQVIGWAREAVRTHAQLLHHLGPLHQLFDGSSRELPSADPDDRKSVTLLSK